MQYATTRGIVKPSDSFGSIWPAPEPPSGAGWQLVCVCWAPPDILVWTWQRVLTGAEK